MDFDKILDDIKGMTAREWGDFKWIVDKRFTDKGREMKLDNEDLDRIAAHLDLMYGEVPVE